MLTSNKCKNPWAMIQHYIYCHDEWSSLYVHYDLEIEETYLCRIYASVKLPLRKLFNNVLLLRFCFVFFFFFSFFHDNYRWQKPDGLQFTENYMIIVVCEWISVWDILLYIYYSARKKIFISNFWLDPSMKKWKLIPDIFDWFFPRRNKRTTADRRDEPVMGRVPETQLRNGLDAFWMKWFFFFFYPNFCHFWWFFKVFRP